MARFTPDFVATVKDRSNLEEVVREHVTLRPAGPGSLKGLCPLHDEKTPSFTVRPAVGAWHCFGCGEGGDVIAFVRQVEHLGFTEAIERLAGKLGLEPVYEEGSGPRDRGEGLGRRSRLVEAHRLAEELYGELLLGSPAARTARDFMRARGFDSTVARQFGMGFSPRGGEELTAALRRAGFTDEEMVSSGLVGRGNRGLYDRFRGRLMWPIRDITGDTVGFGARRIFDDDRIEAKYLNTAETSIYKKSSVLYGLDLAKRDIARDREAVVVEGYTDVMACHLAGVSTAVATCGTAFGVEHIKVLRRLLRDEAQGGSPARVVFTFDGDAAGQKAALRAFGEDQRWASQSFVAVEPTGMDPCELRQASGDLAVRGLVEDAVPLFEFALRSSVARFDLGHAEGRIQALRAGAPIVASIRDTALRPEYARVLSGMLGLEIDQVQREVDRAQRAGTTVRVDGQGGAQGGAHGAGRGDGRGDGPGARHGSGQRRGSLDVPQGAHDDELEPSVGEAGAAMPVPNLHDPVVLAERQLLQCLLQFPSMVTDADLDAIGAAALHAPAHGAVLDGVRAAGGLPAGRSHAAWLDAVTQAAPRAVHGLIAELAVAPLPVRMDAMTGRPPERYVSSLVSRVREVALTRQIADAMSELRRLDSGGDAGGRAGGGAHAVTSEADRRARSRELSTTLTTLQGELARLRSQQD